MASPKDLRAARLVREMRVDRGLSPEALAYEIYRHGAGAISGKTIRRIELVGVVPTPRIQFALATFFELRPTQLWATERARSAA